MIGVKSSQTECELLPFANANKKLLEFEKDNLHHLYISKNDDNLKRMFGDVKFVCMGGTQSRMYKLAVRMKECLMKSNGQHAKVQNGLKVDFDEDIKDLTKGGDRYSLYKVGPVLFGSHGIGCPSISVLLTEIMKLLFHAQCRDVTFFRIGTCGGIGVKPGSVILTEEALDGLLRPEYRQYVLGKEVIRPTRGHRELIQELIQINQEANHIYDVLSGKTLCAFDFYEAQARLDGIFCDYTENEKLEFLRTCRQDHNVLNIEMESLCFSSYMNYANCKFAIVCVTLLDRLKSDQVSLTHEELLEFQERPFEIVSKYIMKNLNASKYDFNQNHIN